MAHRHSSFLLRCWNLGDHDERIEITHIQSGTTTIAKSTSAAIEWICEQGSTSPPSASDDESEETEPAVD